LINAVKAVGDAKKLFDHVAKALRPLTEGCAAPQKCDKTLKILDNHLKATDDVQKKLVK